MLDGLSAPCLSSGVGQRSAMKIQLSIVVALALLQFLCPLGMACCFLLWFPHLLESLLLKLVSYALGFFFLAGAALVLLGWVVRPKSPGSAQRGTREI